MAYDILRGRTIVFGGTTNSTGFLDDTWEFDGKDWLQVKPKTSPPGRVVAQMVYQLHSRRTLLFGGGGTGGAYLADTWEFDGRTWTRRQPKNSPSGRWHVGLAYDSARNRAVLFGGLNGSGALSDTWEWDGKDWTQVHTPNTPGARASAMAFDSLRKRVVLFGGLGNTNNDTWEYDGKDWTQVNTTNHPSVRCCSAIAYDILRQRTVIYGGFTGPLADTWEFDGAGWTKVPTTTAPPARYDYDFMVYDQRRRRMVLFGGLGKGNTRFRDTWEYIGKRTFIAEPSTLSIASGGTQTFTLNADAPHAWRLYWIFGSLSGTTPGVPMWSKSGSVHLPLNPDFWTDITIGSANSAILTRSRGILNGSGKATAMFHVPKIFSQSAIGLTFHHAYLVYDTKNNFYMASNSVPLQLVK